MYEECYEYNEDACFIADSEKSAKEFMLNCGYRESDYKIDPISFSDIINDYGSSLGEYAMEEKAFQNFKSIAEDNKVTYVSKEFYLDRTLMVVNVKTDQKA